MGLKKYLLAFLLLTQLGVFANPIINSTTSEFMNYYIDVTFNEGVYNTNGGSGALEVSDFQLSLSGGVATTPVVTQVTTTTNTSLSGGENSIRVYFTYSGTANGSETLTVNPNANQIFNAIGEVASDSQSNNTFSFISEGSGGFLRVSSTQTLSSDVSYLNVAIDDGQVLAVAAGKELKVTGKIQTFGSSSLRLLSDVTDGPA